MIIGNITETGLIGARRAQAVAANESNRITGQLLSILESSSVRTAISSKGSTARWKDKSTEEKKATAPKPRTGRSGSTRRAGKCPSPLLDDPAGARETHVFAAAAFSIELALIEAIRRVAENDAQIGQICSMHSAADDFAAVVGTAHLVVDWACVGPGNARSTLI